MSGIIDWLKSIAEGISSLSSSIIDGIGDFFSDLGDKISSIPSAIINGIKAIFTPNNEEIQSSFNTMLTDLKNRLGLQSLDFMKEDLNEVPLSDVNGNYMINGLGILKVKFLDVNYLKQGVEFFRPAIQAFIYFLLLIFNYRQLMSFIGQDPGVYSTAHSDYKEFKQSQQKGVGK